MDLVHATAQHCPVCGVPTPTGRCPLHGVSGVAHVPPQMAFAPGAVLLGRYRIDLALGVHGAQATFLATQLDQPRQVVIEALGVPRLAQRAQELAALFREAKVAALFSRPDLVRVYDFGIEPYTQNPVLVMEYRAGRAIQDIITPGSAELRTAASFVEVCHGLLDADDDALLDPRNPIATAVPTDSPMGLPGSTPPGALSPPTPPPGPPGPAEPVAARPGSAIRLSPGSSQERLAMKKPARPPAAPTTKRSERGWSGIGLSVAAVLLVGVIYVLTSDDLRRRAGYGPQVSKTTTYMVPAQKGRRPRGAPTRTPLGDKTVQIDSDPAGAQAWAGTRLLGQTPLTVPRPTAGGRLRVTLKKEGFLDKQITLHRDSGDEVSAKLFADGSQEEPGIVGERKVVDPLKSGNYGKNPLDKDPYESPLGTSPFTNPFGQPGTAPVGGGGGDAPSDDDS